LVAVAVALALHQFSPLTLSHQMAPQPMVEQALPAASLDQLFITVVVVVVLQIIHSLQVR
jgi:hypothetical protein